MSHLSGQMAAPPNVAWRGQRSEPRHAWRISDRGRIKAGMPALCGAGWIDDRWLVPGGAKCEACTAKLDDLTREALVAPALGL